MIEKNNSPGPFIEMRKYAYNIIIKITLLDFTRST